MAVRSFKDLIVWQKASRLTEYVYRLTKVLPDPENTLYQTSCNDPQSRLCLTLPKGMSVITGANTSNFWV